MCRWILIRSKSNEWKVSIQELLKTRKMKLEQLLKNQSVENDEWRSRDGKNEEVGKIKFGIVQLRNSCGSH